MPPRCTILAFDVFLNGTKLCTLGMPQGGVMSAGVHYVSEEPDRKRAQELALSVGGYASDGIHDDHFGWLPRHLKLGDEIIIRITEAAQMDVPEYHERGQTPEELKLEYKQMRLEQLKAELEG